ncbi:uncharacterized protein EV420DRAFT_1594186 [Desarmillaria tabescens]|uniref:Uncharacterized protein n=1 Tax=Armillaria tabescens TaxID=1929756 RepID=A0AA39MHN2_ARMTA|nr:uncharacterized protein EV420DRAFT_1594186 [Desarmillaria tabescens]KAK0435226.1 hypothetical protein EV420DRAFT_1594186 [Desarmillaria tabescens]
MLPGLLRGRPVVVNSLVLVLASQHLPWQLNQAIPNFTFLVSSLAVLVVRFIGMIHKVNMDWYIMNRSYFSDV